MEAIRENSVVLADSRQLESFLSPASADLIITGPPYFNEVVYSADQAQLSRIADYQLFLRELGQVWCGCAHILKNGGVLAVWAHDFFRKELGNTAWKYIPFHTDMLRHMPDTLTLRTITVWNRYLPKSQGHMPDRSPLGTRLEYLVILQKNGVHGQNHNLITRSLSEHFWNPVWEYKTSPALFGSRLLFRLLYAVPQPIKRLFAPLTTQLRTASFIRDSHQFQYYHTECPPEIAERCIQDFSRPGDLVVDPFVGSGTTIKAALRLRRRYIGVDINEEAIRAINQKVGRTISIRNLKNSG